MQLRRFIQSLIDLGIQENANEATRRRTRLINVLIYLAIILLFPIIIVQNLVDSKFILAYLAIAALIVSIISFVLNIMGRTHVASFILIIMTMILTVMATLSAESQIGASYMNLCTAVAALYLFENRTLRNCLMISSIGIFAILNYYQLAYLPFDRWDYIATVPTLILFFAGLSYADREISKYQLKIEKQNSKLKDQNETILAQSEQIIESEKERHQQEILLKQKDLDTTLANISFQEKLNRNITKQLRGCLKGDHLEKEIQALIYDLTSQLERVDKLSILHENLEEVNASLYSRLLEEHPALTKSELELCALIRLGLSVKEVATYRGSTENSTMVLRSRLRKKLKLDEQNLSIYLLNF